MYILGKVRLSQTKGTPTNHFQLNNPRSSILPRSASDPIGVHCTAMREEK